MMHRIGGIPLILAILVSMVGCSPEIKPVQITGKLVVHGNPYTVGFTEQVFVVLISVSGLRAEARVGPDASFTVQGPLKGAIPAGFYRVAITTKPIPGADPTEEQAMKFDDFHPSKSPLSIEVGPTPIQTLTIDLGKKSVALQ
ncbi:hypothetical protein [Tuwongella immobilis]|uniref:Lipoprotein n=1 Tax=Tuwongella immobilis TaxID=692036 RepID=A0A6C2YH00_9BACT|nr:hypothetical protein [Tuwongella immobilis]VIP00634.1 unnamed protein product [Tuwongella immobilis]VTR96686.1 unnamed protein product [Tuwongella immobilis]